MSGPIFYCRLCDQPLFNTGQAYYYLNQDTRYYKLLCPHDPGYYLSVYDDLETVKCEYLEIDDMSLICFAGHPAQVKQRVGSTWQVIDTFIAEPSKELFQQWREKFKLYRAFQ